MIRTASEYSVTLCLTVLLICSCGATVLRAQTVKEGSGMESAMTSGSTCQSSTTLSGTERATVSALLTANAITQPAISECENSVNPVSVYTNELALTEGSRAPPTE